MVWVARAVSLVGQWVPFHADQVIVVSKKRAPYCGYSRGRVHRQKTR